LKRVLIAGQLLKVYRIREAYKIFPISSSLIAAKNILTFFYFFSQQLVSQHTFILSLNTI
jgi:hypothetical protein